MSARKRPLRRWLVALTVLVLPLFVAAVVPGQETGDRQNRIEDLKQKIDALTNELDALKNGTTTATPLPADWAKSLHWRCTGPAAMGDRITDLSVFA